MAGAAVRPGDWMPATLMNPAASVGPMRKSSPLIVARVPANWAMMSRSLRDRYEPTCFGEHLGLAGGSGCVVVEVVDLFGGGADHDRAVVGGDDEGALAHWGGAGVDDVADEVAEAFVEQVFLTFSAPDLETVDPGHVGDGGGTEAGGVDDEPGTERAGRCGDRPYVAIAVEVADGAVGAEPDSVGYGRFDQPEHRLVGVDDRGVR